MSIKNYFKKTIHESVITIKNKILFKFYKNKFELKTLID